MEKIIDLNLPTLEQMNDMSLEELTEWLETLHPFYYERSKILDMYGIEAYQKTLKWSWFYQMIQNLKQGINRWKKIAEYPPSKETSELWMKRAGSLRNNPTYRHIETGTVVTALDWAKETYLDTRKALIQQGEIDANEEIPSDKEFIESGILELDGDEEYERI